MDVIIRGNTHTFNYSLMNKNESVAMFSNVSTNNDSAYSQESLLHLFNDNQLHLQLPAIVYTTLMMILGLPGNLIVCYVYFFKWRRSTSRVFILGIALLDLFNCATTLPVEIYIMHFSVMFDHPLLCKIARFSTFYMNSSAATILVGIAVDRFQHICRPHCRSFSRQASLNICLASLVSALVFTWPTLFLYGTRRLDLGGITGHACLLENKFDTAWYPVVYLAVMMFVTMTFFVVLAVLYTLIYRQIYRHRQVRKTRCSHMLVSEDGTRQYLDSVSQSIIAGQRTVEEEAEHNANEHINENITHGTGGASAGGTSPKKSENSKETTQSELVSSVIRSDLTPRSTVTHNNGMHLDGSQSKDASSSRVPEANVSQFKVTATRSMSLSGVRRSVRYFLVRSFRHSETNECTMCGTTVRVGRSTLMLFLVTITYILSFVPFYTIVILRQADTSFIHNLSASGTMMYHLFLRSYLLSSAINPFIYCFCNKQFREYCKDLFVHVILRRPQSQAMIKMQQSF